MNHDELREHARWRDRRARLQNVARLTAFLGCLVAIYAVARYRSSRVVDATCTVTEAYTMRFKLFWPRVSLQVVGRPDPPVSMVEIPGGKDTKTREEAMAQLQAYPVGAQLPCVYNAHDERDVVLIRPTMGVAPWLAGLLFAIAAVALAKSGGERRTETPHDRPLGTYRDPEPAVEVPRAPVEPIEIVVSRRSGPFVLAFIAFFFGLPGLFIVTVGGLALGLEGRSRSPEALLFFGIPGLLACMPLFFSLTTRGVRIEPDTLVVERWSRLGKRAYRRRVFSFAGASNVQIVNEPSSRKASGQSVVATVGSEVVTIVSTYDAEAAAACASTVREAIGASRAEA